MRMRLWVVELLKAGCWNNGIMSKNKITWIVDCDCVVQTVVTGFSATVP